MEFSSSPDATSSVFQVAFWLFLLVCIAITGFTAWRDRKLPVRIAGALASVALLVGAGVTAVGSEQISAPHGFEDGPILTCDMDRLDYSFAEVDDDDTAQRSCQSESRTKVLALALGAGCIPAAFLLIAMRRRRTSHDAGVASPV